MEKTKQKNAFIAIVGKPNAGKSSILNAIIKQKVSIVSNKPQTTRTRVTGIYTENEYQIVFIDTPGLLKPKNRLGEYMVKSITSSVAGVDACVLVIDAEKPLAKAEDDLIREFKNLGIPAILAINKIDLIRDKTKLMELIAAYSEKFQFDAVVPVSALNKSGINILKDEIKKLCTDGVHFFDDNMITESSDRVLAEEFVREKLLRNIEKEIPHGIAVITEQFEEYEDILDISELIVCEKPSHKSIIIGKGGSMLKKVGTEARLEMERFFGCKVNLKLWVKVKEDWRNRESLLKGFGYDKENFSQ